MASPEEMMQSMIANFAEKTGKSLEDWTVLAKTAPEQKHGKIVAWLKSTQGLTHGYANMVATAVLKPESFAPKTAQDDADLTAAQYVGKENLKPLYDSLIKAATQLGADVEIAPKKAYVSLRRNKQFALVQPSTKTRVDLGLCMKGVDASGRLEAAGSFNAMASHRIKLGSVDEIDDDVLGWLRQAYEAS
jgi:predicted transport protein